MARDLQQLWTHIPNVIKEKIKAIELNFGADRHDMIVWKGSSDGVPTTKYFFRFISQTKDQGNPNEWQCIWKLKCPQKLHFFIWLTAHDKLITNGFHASIALDDPNHCPRYQQETENIIHPLQDYPKSNEVWESFLLHSKLHRFFRLPLKQWIRDNINGVARVGTCTNTDWEIIYLYPLLGIYGKPRNEEVFGQMVFSTYKVIRQASMFATDMQLKLDQFTYLNLDPTNGRWFKPPPGYFKLNVDGGFTDRQGTYSGILQYDWGFTGKFNAHDPLHAEIMAIKEGLWALMDWQMCRVIIEMTHLSRLILYINILRNPIPIFVACKRLHTQWSSPITYVPVTFNVCAAKLDNNPPPLLFEIYIYIYNWAG